MALTDQPPPARTDSKHRGEIGTRQEKPRPGRVGTGEPANIGFYVFSTAFTLYMKNNLSSYSSPLPAVPTQLGQSPAGLEEAQKGQDQPSLVPHLGHLTLLLSVPLSSHKTGRLITHVPRQGRS